MSSTVLAQSSSSKSNFHSGNKLRVTLQGNGKIERNNEIAIEWPISSGYEYLDLALPLVMVESGGNQQLPNFVVDYRYSSIPDGTVAMNHMKDTWPSSWPDKPASWDGEWNGFFGKGVLTSDQESYFVLEDQSLSIRLRIRGWQWSHYLAQDMLYIHYELENFGSTGFDRAIVGFFARPAPGGDGYDDILEFQDYRAQVVAVDKDNVGEGRGYAADIGRWSPVGRFVTTLLETPGNSTDGIDNDLDGLTDESRSDGIDNDGDWITYSDKNNNGSWDPGEPLNDDVGADGVPNSGDEGEGNGIPTTGEPNFDKTDIDESDQIGLTSFAAFPANSFNSSNSSSVWSALSPGRFDSPSGANEFVLGSGYVPLEAGKSLRFSIVLFYNASKLDQSRNEETVDRIFSDNYKFPIAPPPPKLNAVSENNSVTLYWDTNAEEYDGFEGYKIYRSTDPGFNDVFTVTDDKGHLIYSDPIQTFDLNNSIEDLFPKHSFGFRYYLGKNTGLTHWWTDVTPLNGKKYYYAVVAYNRGEVDAAAENHNYPTESTKSIVVTSSGELITDVNTVVVVPTVESSGYNAPNYFMDHSEGNGTGEVTVEIIDRTLVRDAVYEISFDSTNGDTTYSIQNVTEPANPITVVENSNDYSTDELLNDSDPMIDGMRIFLFNDALRWDFLNTGWKSGNTNWSVRMDLNANIGAPIAVPVDYEVRFDELGVDTAIFNIPIPVPFEIWNVTESKKENFVVLDQNPANGLWDSGEPIYVVEGDNLQNFPPVYWMITIAAPQDTTIESIPPEEGDVAFIPTRKPFAPSDFYSITTDAAKTEQEQQQSTLDNVKVVPNPYIVSNRFEQNSVYTGGNFEHRLQFIHLPQKCIIRIFNLRGYLIDTIEHESAIDNGSTFWDLRSAGSDKIVAFGVYIYHIDAQNIGERIGRFAIIR
jgi:hypothetical protein